jgi:hypothetical protein
MRVGLLVSRNISSSSLDLHGLSSGIDAAARITTSSPHWHIVQLDIGTLSFVHLDSRHSANWRAILARLSAVIPIPIINRQKARLRLQPSEGKWVLA